MTSRASARARLIELARTQLPTPGDPRKLIEQLQGVGADPDEQLQVLARVSLAHRQLRDLKLEAAFQSGYGWFLGRNLILFGVLGLIATLFVGLPVQLLEPLLAGAAGFFILGALLAPLRLRRQGARRDGILAAYAADLGGYLDELGASEG